MLTDEQLEDLAALHIAPQVAAGEKLDLMPLLRAVEAAEREACKAECLRQAKVLEAMGLHAHAAGATDCASGLAAP